MKSSGKARSCIEIADYGELCYLKRQCEFRLGLNAECKNGQCSCRDGSHYVLNENACFNSSSKSNNNILIFSHIWNRLTMKSVWGFAKSFNIKADYSAFMVVEIEKQKIFWKFLLWFCSFTAWILSDPSPTFSLSEYTHNLTINNAFKNYKLISFSSQKSASTVD